MANDRFGRGADRRHAVGIGQAALLAMTVAALAGCGGKDQKVVLPPPPPPPATVTAAVPPTPVATPGLKPRQRTALAFEMLDAGRVAEARVEVQEVLKTSPGDRLALGLLEQINTDPKALLGADSFAYIVQPGDTMPILAARFLGAGSRFYALARYNGIAVPSSLQPGQTIMIPGRARAPVMPRTPRRAPASPRATASAPAAPIAEAPRQAVADPARAGRLRRAGLERMSAGSINAAVQLLGRAQRLDPANAAIGADLARARRIQSTVRGRR